jgi:hypothetical protein
MQPHPITMTIIFGQPHAIVLDAQQTFVPDTFQIDFDHVGATVSCRVPHGFLGDPHEVGFRFVVKPKTTAIPCEGARDAVRVADIPRQGLESVNQTGAAEAQAMRKVARLADRLVQQPDDLGGRLGRTRLGKGRETSR